MSADRHRRIGHLLRILLLLMGVTLAGTLGFRFLEGWPLLDALYMTIITLTTVGFGEVRELSVPGRWFTIGLMISSLGVVAYSATSIAALLIETEFRGMLWRRRMQKRIGTVNGHYLICGFGHTGRAVSQALERHGLPYVVIEENPARAEALKLEETLLVVGDASDDACLHAAGIDRATGLIASLGNDAENVYLVLSARQLNPGLKIVAWADTHEAEGKIKRAGADYVLSPYLLGGARLVQFLLSPHALEFLDHAIGGEYHDVHLDEIELGTHSPLVGDSLKGLGIGRDIGVIVIGVSRAGGGMVFNPPGDYIFHDRDVLIGIGSPSQFERLREICTRPRASGK